MAKKKNAFGIHIMNFICGSCGDCIEACKNGVLEFSFENKPVPVKLNKCVGCFTCANTCARKVIKVFPAAGLIRGGGR